MGTIITAIISGLLSTGAHAASGNELAVFSCNTSNNSAKIDVTILEKEGEKSHSATIAITNIKGVKAVRQPVETYVSDADVVISKEENKILRATINFASAKSNDSAKERFSLEGFSYTSTYEGMFRGETVYCHSTKEKEVAADPLDATDVASEI